MMNEPDRRSGGMSARWRGLSRITIAGSLLGLLTGCFGMSNRMEGDHTPSPASPAAGNSPSPVTLTVFGAANPAVLTHAFQDDEVMTELQRRTGVKLDFSPSVNVTDPSIKLSVMLAN